MIYSEDDLCLTEEGEEYSHSPFHYLSKRINLQLGSLTEQPIGDRA